MVRLFSLCLVMFVNAVIPVISHPAELKAVGSITAFGGAERTRVDSSTGIGGLDALGLLPITRNVGLQGGFYLAGGQGLRAGLNAGPVLNFPSGKLGLFVDYEHQARHDFNYVGLRGTGGYYLDRFDVLLNYSQPVSSVQRHDDRKFTGMNEINGILRFYPTSEIEVNGGILVNNFAGPGRDDHGGTGVGGSFGVSFKLFDPIVVQLVQGKFDNRERYRVTSGIQIIWGSPLQEYLREQISLPALGGTTPVGGSASRPQPRPTSPCCGDESSFPGVQFRAAGSNQ